MASPYRPSAAIAAASGAGGFVQLTESEYANLLQLIARIPLIDEMDAMLPAKIYEPVAVSGEILFTTEGDCIMNWGGLYAS